LHRRQGLCLHVGDLKLHTVMLRLLEPMIFVSILL
jgi:hypothetical protein